MSTIPGIATRDFTDAGTGQTFVSGQRYDLAPAVYDNYLFAGLVTDINGGGSPSGATPPNVLSDAASIGALTAGQASGVDPILSANPNRRSLKIVPPVACLLKVSSGQSDVGGIPLLGVTTNEFADTLCPRSALYIRGLPEGSAVTIWEG